MGFLNLERKNIVVFGLANRKSVACAVSRILVEEGARVFLVVRTQERHDTACKIFPEASVYICDVEDEDNITRVSQEIAVDLAGQPVYGIVHSIAFANYSEGLKPFHETRKQDFLQAMDISCFSLITIANHFKSMMADDGAVVTISISTTRMAAENYGYMAPVKAALESSICFLAKSFSAFSKIRFNAVCPGLLKTSASAGIPGYVDSYLFAEQLTLRKESLTTNEVGNAVAFLLSDRSSGINAQTMVLDAGMGVNYFDAAVIAAAVS
ncbi:MAG: SDR family oxidoreductase [Proteobacteria bacterium]|nr:SDR family oxidoreductase [Pseudomonadota bacterium]MBU1686553.1 SDR family oxidoreductase [Pseudomonadota bacterium]